MLINTLHPHTHISSASAAFCSACTIAACSVLSLWRIWALSRASSLHPSAITWGFLHLFFSGQSPNFFVNLLVKLKMRQSQEQLLTVSCFSVLIRFVNCLALRHENISQSLLKPSCLMVGERVCRWVSWGAVPALLHPPSGLGCSSLPPCPQCPRFGSGCSWSVLFSPWLGWVKRAV